MSSEGDSLIPLCDIHTDEVAQALCHFHNKLLCISCVIEKQPECSLTEIRKVSGEKDNLLLELLKVRQIATKKEQMLEEHEKKTTTLKIKLNQDVTDIHESLTKRLDEMKEKCLLSIDEQAKSLTVANTHNIQLLDEFKTKLNEHINKLSTSSADDVFKIQTELKEVKTEMIQNIPDKDSVPEGDFKRNERLCELILQSGTSLGIVSLIDPDRYEKVDYIYVRSSNQGYSTPDEVVYATDEKKTDYTEPEVNTKRNDSTKKQSENRERKQSSKLSCESENKKSPAGKSEKRISGIFKWKLFSSDKKEGKEMKADTQNEQEGKTKVPRKRSTEEAEEVYVYQESTYVTPSYQSPKYLINKIVIASALKQFFSLACKFSKLVDLGDGYIGMLSEVLKSLVLVGTGGQVLGKKTFKAEKMVISAAGDKEVAVIVEPGLQVSKYKVSDKGFSTAGGFIVPEEISNITGFDFDVTLSQFAISSKEKLIILNKSGKKLKVVPSSNTNPAPNTEIATAYDFNSQCLCTLNIRDKTFKKYSFQKSEALWKRKLEEDYVNPRSIVLYKDKVCIACGSGICIFSKESGEPIKKYDTYNLLDDCLAICVIDDVIVFSSNSDNFEKSTTLAYISL